MRPYRVEKVVDQDDVVRLVEICKQHVGKGDEYTILDQRTDEGEKATTGQCRVCVLCSEERVRYLESHNEAIIVVKDSAIAKPDLQLLKRVVTQIMEKCGFGAHQLREVELIGTPPQAPVQRKHRDSRFNHSTVFLYLTSSLSTYLAKGSESHPFGVDLEELDYHQMPMQVGDALVNHSMWPHGGPGNSGREWRFICSCRLRWTKRRCHIGRTKRWCGSKLDYVFVCVLVLDLDLPFSRASDRCPQVNEVMLSHTHTYIHTHTHTHTHFF